MRIVIHMTNNEQARRKIRAALALRGWTTTDLGRELGYDADFLRHVICGQSVTIRARKKISDLLGQDFWGTSKGKCPAPSQRSQLQARNAV